MASASMGSSTGQRLAIGEAVLTAARAVDAKPIKKSVARLAKAHRTRIREQRAVDRAEAKLSAQRRKLGEADAKQDILVEALATARVAAGAKRTKPFEDLGVPPPSEIKTLGYVKEARLCISLTTKIVKKKERAGVVAAAKRLAKASQAVIAASQPIPALENALARARASRDANEQEWETAFAALRDGAKVFDHANGTKLHDAMFVRTAETRAAPKQRQAAVVAERARTKKAKPAPSSPTNGAAPPTPPAPSTPSTPPTE
jgi:hypothetical protein